MSFHLQLLGPVQVSYDDQPVTRFRSSRVKALLCYLAAGGSGQVQRREALQALFWPDMLPQSAQGNLRQTLYSLRKLVGEFELDVPLLLNRPGAITLNPAFPITTDIEQFRRLRIGGMADLEQAVELYRADFMADLHLPDANPFEAWLASRRAHYHRQMLASLTTLTEAKLAANELAGAERYARRQLELDGLQESAHRQLMTILSRQGQRSAALQQYEQCRDLLQRELGALPAADTVALREQIAAAEIPALTASAKHEIGIITAAGTAEPEAVPHNLPRALTAFIGREAELEDLAELLAAEQAPLITIVGPGGMGKTRLALAAAERQLSQGRYTDGIYVVDLTPVEKPENVAKAIADCLELRMQLDDESTDVARLAKRLQRRKLLLLLDNFEHILLAASVVSTLLAGAPDLQIMVTSRERLNLRGERIYPLTGLATAVANEATNPGEVKPNDYAAAKLFRQAAQRVAPHSAFSTPNERMVLQRICQLVSGMPLALELAAGWVDVLSLDEIVAELQRGLDLLESELHDLPERQRSVQATLEYSWQLLKPAEQRVVAAMAVFKNGFTRAAAEWVCKTNLRQLSRLAGKSFLHFDQQRHRYGLHELVRQFCVEKLAHSGEANKVAQRHSDYYLDFVVEREANLRGHGQMVPIRAIRADLGNIRQACRWAVTVANYDSFCRGFTALNAYFTIYGQDMLAYAVREELLAILETKQGEAHLTAFYKVAVRNSRPRSQHIGVLEEATAFFEGQCDWAEVAQSLSQLGFAYVMSGHTDKGIAFQERGLQLAQRYRDPFFVAGHRMGLGRNYGMTGRPVEGLALLELSVNWLRAQGDKLLCQYGLFNISTLYWQLGRFRDQERCCLETIPLTEFAQQPEWKAVIESHLIPLAVLKGEAVSAKARLARVSAELDTQEGAIFDVLDKRGLIALATGAYRQARSDFQKSRAIWLSASPRLDAMRAFAYYWGLSLAESGLGNFEAARMQLVQGLVQAVAVNEIGNAKLYLPVAALLLHEASQSARGVEILALATNQLVGWVGWLESMDMFIKLRHELEHACGPAGFGEAWARGEDLELMSTVELVIAELEELSEAAA